MRGTSPAWASPSSWQLRCPHDISAHLSHCPGSLTAHRSVSTSPNALMAEWSSQPKQHANKVCPYAESQNQGGVLSHQTMVLQ